MKVIRKDSSEGNVWKYIFYFEDAVAEAVLYRYGSFNQRTVICCSVMSGCPVGCKFCGTGERYVRNLSHEEILAQVKYVLKDYQIDPSAVEKMQIMFMSMGEPMLNMENVDKVIREMNGLWPNAQLLISTVGIADGRSLDTLFHLSKEVSQVGLQFSIHRSTDSERDKLIPYSNKLRLSEIKKVGEDWNSLTGRPVYLNYCIDNSNQKDEDFERLRALFDPRVFYFTFSVVCSKSDTAKAAGYRNLERIREIANLFVEAGYNTRVFDPAGQDDIGGGCGQLFETQKWMKEHTAIMEEREADVRQLLKKVFHP